jgi:hypothetical protein
MATDNVYERTKSSSTVRERDDWLTLIAAYHFLIGGLFLLATLVMMLPTFILGIVGISGEFGAFIGMFAVGLIAIVILLLCLLYLSVGYGIWTLQPWGRISAITLSIISLFFFPIGTIIGGLILWYLLKPEIAIRFSPVP